MTLLRVALSLSFVVLLCGGQAAAVDQSICNPGSKVVLAPDGSLMSCVLKDFYTANGVRCNEKRPIGFYPDGQLESCDLADQTTVGDQQCQQFSQISFYADGSFKSCTKRE